jgi:hypothetical protein
MFRSFFQAGFECATGYNKHRQPIDQICATQHDRYLEDDYARLTNAGIFTVREGLSWRHSDLKGQYDFSYLDQVIRASRKFGIEVIFDLFHYGYPDDVDLFAESMIDRFAEYAQAAAKRIAGSTEEPWHVAPVNEPSYFSWAAGDAALFAPHKTGASQPLKQMLVRAAIRATDAMWDAVPYASIVTVDPICRVVASDAREAFHFNNVAVFESLDMLSGRSYAEFGGSPRHLGTIGINYYWNNQWELGGDTLAGDDVRRLPFREILRSVYDRYGCDIFVSETSHVNEHRGPWLSYVTEEVLALLHEDVPVHGVCLYPILGMPEWHDQNAWTRLGLWDLIRNDFGDLERHLHIPLFEVLKESQAKIAKTPIAKAPIAKAPVGSDRSPNSALIVGNIRVA